MKRSIKFILLIPAIICFAQFFAGADMESKNVGAACSGNPVYPPIPSNHHWARSLYYVKHTFNLMPGGNATPIVKVIYNTFANTWESNPTCNSSDIKNNTVNISASGIQPTNISSLAFGCPSKSEGSVCFTIDPFAAGTAVAGQIQAFGFTQVISKKRFLRTPASVNGISSSSAFVSAQGGNMRNGSIEWIPEIHDAVEGRSQQRLQFDPIKYYVKDLVTNEHFEGTLLTISMKLSEGKHQTSVTNFWMNDTVHIESDNAEFIVDFPSPFTSNDGSIKLLVEGGLVTQSSDTGIYNGVLPPVGTHTPVTFRLPSFLKIDYDLGNFNNDSVDVTITMDDGGEQNSKLNISSLILDAVLEGPFGIPDTASVYLRRMISPYALIDSAIAIVGNNVHDTTNFIYAENGTPYYLIVKNRNSIETWSSTGVSFDSGYCHYDFTNSASKAYGNNLKLKNGKWCIYSGDVNQDGNVDLADLLYVDNDVYNFVAGYVNTDVNGDRNVDASDLGIVDENTFNYITKITPP